jgi:hypothetical protein
MFIFPLVPKSKVLMSLAPDEKVTAVTVLPSIFNNPEFKVMAPSDAFPDTNIPVVGGDAGALAEIVVAPVTVRLPAVPSVISRSTDVKVRLAIVNEALTVAVKLVPVSELISKIALSAAPGTDAPPAPPDDVDHFAVSFQFPAPPTQYLSATATLR